MSDPKMRCKPTAEIPLIDIRRARMLETFYSGGLAGLMKEMYKIAEEDLAACQSNNPAGRRHVEKAMMAMAADGKGSQEMLKLLYSIPKEVTETLILNTIGHRYQTDDESKKLFYRTDATSGVYINTFVVERNDSDNDKGLTRLQWKGIQKTVQDYTDSEGVEIGPNSTPEEKRIASEAQKIDDVYGARLLSQFLGERHWVNAGDLTTIFYTKMRERNRKDLDTLGKTHQLQTPIEAGCGIKLSARMPAHDRWSGLAGTAAPWGLLLSCLEVAKINITTISLPIFKVWSQDQYKLAEILITMLTGSMVHDGGCNPKQPGTNPGRPATYQYGAEKREVFLQHDWLEKNLEEEGAVTTRTLKEAEWIKKTLAKTNQQDKSDLGVLEAAIETSRKVPEDRLVSITKLAEKLRDDLRNNNHLLIARIEETEARKNTLSRRLKAATKHVAMEREPLEFHKHVDDWLEGRGKDDDGRTGRGQGVGGGSSDE